MSAPCHYCKTESVSFYSSVEDRGALEMKKGKTIGLTCKACHKKYAYPLNSLKASSSISVKLLALVLLLISTGVLFILLKTVHNLGYVVIGGVYLIPGIIFSIAISQERNKINRFNRYKIKP